MKVFKDGKLYVNKNDLLILRKSKYQVPVSVFGGRESNLILLGIEKDVFLEFSDEKDIEFFKKIDWIVDYDSVRDLDLEVLKKLMVNTKSTMNMLRARLDSMGNLNANLIDAIRFDMLKQMLLSLESVYESRVTKTELFGMLQKTQNKNDRRLKILKFKNK